MSAAGKYGGMARWVALVVVIVVGSGAAGWWLATVTAPNYDPERHEPPSSANLSVDADATEHGNETYQPPEPPLYFYARIHGDADQDLVGQEIQMAGQAGIDQWIVSAEIDWSVAADYAALLEDLDWINSLNPKARIVVELNLDPPLAWLAAHTDDAVGGVAADSVSVASNAWRKEVTTRLSAFAQAVAQKPSVVGALLACLDQGQWGTTTTGDTSIATAAGFREWLTAKYVSDEAMQEAWADDKVSLQTASPPVAGSTENGEDQAVAPLRDFHLFLSDACADAIASFASTLNTADESLEVWARYGRTLSAEDAASGQFALRRVLESSVDAVVLPMAALDRGLGGSGGYAGPIHSMLAHGKQCILLDDTYTGLARNAETGELERVRGMSYETVSQIHQRNFASALVQGIGVAWADPEGDGRLHDDELWEQFAAMRQMYLAWHEQNRAFDARNATVRGTPFPPGGAGLALVVDERARADDPDAIQAPLIASVMNAALRCGVQIQVWLLDDFLEGHVDQVPVIVFANTFALTEPEHARVHERLAERKAAAVWLFSPGATGTGDDAAANVSSTVRMNAKAFDEPIPSGSTYALDSQWINTGGTFGGEDAPNPRFYIDDENADVLATYTDTEKASVTFTTTPEEWASVFVGEARLTPQLLQEILQLLEVYTLTRNYTAAAPACYLGPHTLAIHASEAGDVTLYLGGHYDVQDAVDPSQGWLAKSALKLTTTAHESRIFTLVPSALPAPISDDPLPPDENATKTQDEVSNEE